MRKEWYFLDEDCRPRGPLTAHEVAMIAARLDVQAWKPGMSRWAWASRLPEICAVFQAETGQWPERRSQPPLTEASSPGARVERKGQGSGGVEMEKTRPIAALLRQAQAATEPTPGPEPVREGTGPEGPITVRVESLETLRSSGSGRPRDVFLTAAADPVALKRVMEHAPAALKTQDGKLIGITKNWVIGRSITCDFVAATEGMSREHCAIRTNEHGQSWLMDLGSLNGTFLNGHRVSEPVLLSLGDRITVPGAEFIFLQKRTDPIAVYSGAAPIQGPDPLRDNDLVWFEGITGLLYEYAGEAAPDLIKSERTKASRWQELIELLEHHIEDPEDRYLFAARSKNLTRMRAAELEGHRG